MHQDPGRTSRMFMRILAFASLGAENRSFHGNDCTGDFLCLKPSGRRRGVRDTRAGAFVTFAYLWIPAPEARSKASDRDHYRSNFCSNITRPELGKVVVDV
ncbi:hypothetical protein EVAR_59533_1 [Eumeta japonica]|uniref:Uncharacterized protein n=1 Tax=Eumeta variegata TaxID=151549 RepID=A0A4C1XSA4_EUMVA|nr:hypothetical protein EVAR_59533_1 [Eumeta japonica]